PDTQSYTIDGGDDTDTAFIIGAAEEDFSEDVDGNVTTLTGTGGNGAVITLTDVENIVFLDAGIAFSGTMSSGGSVPTTNLAHEPFYSEEYLSDLFPHTNIDYSFFGDFSASSSSTSLDSSTTIESNLSTGSISAQLEITRPPLDRLAEGTAGCAMISDRLVL